MNILLIFPGFIIAFIIVFCYERKIRNLSVKPKNNVHFYVARDKNGELFLYLGKPFRGRYAYRSKSDGVIHLNWLNIKKYGLNEHDYANLKWECEIHSFLINNEKCFTFLKNTKENNQYILGKVEGEIKSYDLSDLFNPKISDYKQKMIENLEELLKQLKS